MQIYCPKCHAGYQVDESLLESTSRKLKCSGCGAVFTIDEGIKTQELVENPFDSLKTAMAETIQEGVSTDRVLSAEPAKQVINEASVERAEQAFVEEEKTLEENSEVANGNLEKEKTEKEGGNVDLEKIFERLSEHAEHLIEKEKKLPFYKKAWFQIKNVLGFHFKIRWVYVFSFCLLFFCVTLYNHRYNVVRKAPFMNVIFKGVGIRAKIPGEGLEFQNIGWEFDTDESGSRLEIKGFIGNSTDRDVALPTVHIEILDKNTSLLQSQNKEMDENKVEASSRLPIDFVIYNPAPTAKYVYMTFIDRD